MATPVSAGQSPAGDDSLAFDIDDDGVSSPRRSRTRPLKRAIQSDDSDVETSETPTTRRRPGRPRVNHPSQKLDKISASVVPPDAIQEPVQVEDDEIVLAHVDEDGERKVDENGALFGDRAYRVRSFTILGRGQRLYMLSTEPARCMGYRDSYLFFLKHKTLNRIILDDNEKNDLADRELIPNGYRTRQIAVVTARSVFREFGARAVIGGRRITDDYWEKEYKKRGFEAGHLADPDDRLPPVGVEYNVNQFVAWHGASNVYHQQPHQERRSTRRVPAIDDVNWITAHAQAASSYNAELGQYRRRMLEGVHEAHTGQWVYPAITQTEHFKWHEIADSDQRCEDRRIVDTIMLVRPSLSNRTNLLEVDLDIFATAPQSIKDAIQAQRTLEQLDKKYLQDRVDV